MSFKQDIYQRFYSKSLALSYLCKTGCRLPTYLQILLCYEPKGQQYNIKKKAKYNSPCKFEAFKMSI